MFWLCCNFFVAAVLSVWRSSSVRSLQRLFQLYFESLDLTDPATLNSVGYILTSDGEATRHLRLAAACLLELLFEMLPPEFAELLFRHAVRMLADPDSDVAKAVAEICAQLTVRRLLSLNCPIVCMYAWRFVTQFCNFLRNLRLDWICMVVCSDARPRVFGHTCTQMPSSCST